MSENVTITIPEPLFRRAKRLALERNQAVNEVLETAITLAEAALPPANQDEIAMTREEAAYRVMHTQLMDRHAGEYVAIFQGQLIDHDQDELALFHRIEDKYPDDVVLLKKVLPWPEPDLHFRSPRLAREGS